MMLSMDHNVVLLFFLLWLVTTNIEAQVASVVVPPVAVNVSLNNGAVFTCTAVADHINWRANNTPVDDIRDKGFDDSPLLVPVNATGQVYSSQLRVLGSHFSNATLVACQALLLITKNGVLTVATSEPVLLLVQGILDAVTELRVDIINSSTLLISWKPPYTLEGVPILFYRVKTNSYYNTTVQNTAVHYQIKPVSETTIEPTVIPVNNVGDGKATSILTNLLFTTTTIMNTELLLTPVTTSLLTTTCTNATVQTSSSTSPEGERVITPVTTIVAAVSAVVTILVTFAGITCIVGCRIQRKKSRSSSKLAEINQDSFITKDNPAYDYLHATAKITTKKNNAYEHIVIKN